jgi:hypothetical protein
MIDTPDEAREALGLLPHRHQPSWMHMGDCDICGNVRDYPLHAMVDYPSVAGWTPPGAASEVTEAMMNALRSYKQADEDGVMVLVSRQALDEAIAALSAQQGEGSQ